MLYNKIYKSYLSVAMGAALSLPLFTACESDVDKLETIEAFEDALNAPSNEPTTDERIAAALEYQVMASLPDETETV